MIRIGTRLLSISDARGRRRELERMCCDQAHLIEPYVCGSLRVRTRTQFELHLFSCEHCLGAVEFELLVKRAVADFAKFAQFSRSWH